MAWIKVNGNVHLNTGYIKAVFPSTGYKNPMGDTGVIGSKIYIQLDDNMPYFIKTDETPDKVAERIREAEEWDRKRFT